MQLNSQNHVAVPELIASLDYFGSQTKPRGSHQTSARSLARQLQGDCKNACSPICEHRARVNKLLKKASPPTDAPFGELEYIFQPLYNLAPPAAGLARSVSYGTSFAVRPSVAPSLPRASSSSDR